VRVLVACEFSGRIRDAFTRRGHCAISCDQYVHPYLFGDPYRKRTGLFLRGLPKLQPTNNCWNQPDRYPILKSWTDVCRDSTLRSVTFKGIAEAMADQWGRG
jgi:hypothetical protein